jgi:hypothetical protein
MAAIVDELIGKSDATKAFSAECAVSAEEVPLNRDFQR